MSYRSTLPMAKNKELFKYYTDAIEHMTNYKSALEEFIGNDSPSDVNTMDAYDKVVYFKAKMDLHDIIGKINAQENNKQVYQDRIDLMMPAFEKLSAEANVEFDNVVQQAIEIGKENPNNRYSNTIGMILQGWHSTKEQKLDGTVMQELKNETYNSLKTQIEAVKKDTKKLKKA
jgi:hypothetical protein